MNIKCILAVALITPLLSASSVAQQYHGGPKSPVPPTWQISHGGDVYAPGPDIYVPRAERRAPGMRTSKSRAYRGGPETVVPHDN